MRQKDPSDVEDNDTEDHIHEVLDLDDQEAVPIDDMDEDMGELGDGDALEEMEERDDSSCTFTKHNEAVFCIRFNPVNNTMIATGGQDDLAYVWNSTDGSVVMTCQGHKDSVTQVAFSHDGVLLATGDMSGLIKVWNVSTKEEVWSFETSDLEWIGWHTGANVLFASDMEGTVWMWKIPSGDLKTFSNTGVSAQTCQLLPDGATLATGYSDGVIKIWDLKSASVKHTITGNSAHSNGVLSMDVTSKDNSNTLLTGSMDGTVHVYNFNSGKLLSTFDCKSSAEEDISVECVSLCTSRPLAAAGTNNGEIFIWDLPSQTCRHKINNEYPVTRIAWHPDSPLLYSTDISGTVSLWDGRTGESTAKFYGHAAEILDLDVSRQGIVFASASEDGTAKIYTVSPSDAD